MSGIDKVVQSVVRQVDVEDVTKLAQSKAIKEVVSEATGEIGEALANGLRQESSDVASTIIESQANSINKTGGFFSRLWSKIFHSAKSQNSSSSNVVSKTSIQTTAEDLQKQIAQYQKQIKTLKNENKNLKTSLKSSTKENSNYKKTIKSFRQNTTIQQQNQVDVDCMNWFQKMFSSKCKFNWNNIKWEVC